MARVIASLSADWFEDDVVSVARDLVGRWLVVDGSTHALIVETEAYGGPEDPASHAAFRPGGRAAIMAREPGLVYVYAAYGMYPCFNIVSGPVGRAAAVLVRSVHLPGGRSMVSGPGRTSRALGITLADHGEQVPGRRFAVTARREACRIAQNQRIGVTRGADIPWRFVGHLVNGGC